MVGFVLLISVAIAAVPSFLGFPVYVALICLVVSLVSALPYYEMMASADREGSKKAVVGFLLFLLHCVFVTATVLAVSCWLVWEEKIRAKEISAQINKLFFQILKSNPQILPRHLHNMTVGAFAGVVAIGVVLELTVGHLARKLRRKDWHKPRPSTDDSTLLMTVYEDVSPNGKSIRLYQRKDGSMFHKSGDSPEEHANSIDFGVYLAQGVGNVSEIRVNTCVSVAWVKLSEETQNAYFTHHSYPNGIIECSRSRQIMADYNYNCLHVPNLALGQLASDQLFRYLPTRECENICRLLNKVAERGLNAGKASSREVRRVLGWIAAVIAMFIAVYVYAELM